MIIKHSNPEPDSRNFCKDALLDSSAYPHSVEEIQFLETHISCIVLTGEYAYKIKKPVDMGFVDYTSLEKRKRFCELEVELNRRFAPGLYLGVVPIFKTATGFRVGDTSAGNLPNRMVGGVVEYAVKMKQFPQNAIAASRLGGDSIGNDEVEAFGRYVANFHDSIEIIDANQGFAQPKQIVQDAGDNFECLLDPLVGDPRFKRLEHLQSWTRSKGRLLQPKFVARSKSGQVRRCHGDLHLKNIIQIDGQLMAFDGIEFNESFQCVDVLSEVAFPVMDFWARGRSDLAWRLLNAYLEKTGDYEDLDVLRFYLVYRAMVRAKVAWLNPGNHSEERRAEYVTTEDPDDRFAGPWDKYLRAAEYFAFGLTPSLSITHGFSGSGKSTIAMNMIAKEGGIRIRSDVERGRLHAQDRAVAKYSHAMSDLVYDRLTELAASVISANFAVFIDATFLKRERRAPFELLAGRLKVDYRIIDCDAPYEELCRRICARRDDPSEANIDVLRAQMKNHEPLTKLEQDFVLK